MTTPKPKPLQATTKPTLDGMTAGAVRALRQCRHLSLDDIDRGCTRLYRRHFGNNGIALLARQLAQSAYQSCQFPRHHFASPGPDASAPHSQFPPPPTGRPDEPSTWLAILLSVFLYYFTAPSQPCEEISKTIPFGSRNLCSAFSGRLAGPGWYLPPLA